LKRRAAAAALLAASLFIGAAQSREAQFNGEYGLWVENRQDSLVVHWITHPASAGFLRVQSEHGQQEFTTPAANAHVQALRRPRGKTVTLVYGTSAQSDTTAISLQSWPRNPVVGGADSVFILGDTHGEFDAASRSLRQAGLIDAQLRWTGGKKTLVFDGDLVDRGPDVFKLLWFIYQLESDAAAKGGRVLVVLGNHETMVWMGDLRYVHPKEQTIAQTYGVPYNKLLDYRESVLGQWLASKPAILKLDNILFAHGGVSAEYLPLTPRAVDDSLAKFMGEALFRSWSDSTIAVKVDSAAHARRAAFFMSDQSAFWFRGYVQTDTLGGMLDDVLKRFGASVHVVGHTPVTMVHQKYNGKLIVTHPRTPGIEMVLLVKDGRNYKRFRIDEGGKMNPLPSVGQ